MNTHYSYSRIYVKSLLLGVLLAQSISVHAAIDTYDPATNQLTLPSVSVSGTTYYNVTVTIKDVVSFDTTPPIAKNIIQGGLTWFPFNDGLKNWADADAYCSGTSTRLPTTDELASLLNSRELDKAPGWSFYEVWSSSTAPSGGHYDFYMSSGITHAESSDSELLSVVCVK